MLSIGVFVAMQFILRIYFPDVSSYSASSSNENSTIISPTTPTFTSDPDPIITCTTSVSNCKGQTLITRKSDCSKSICCGLLYSEWRLFPDISSCQHQQLIEQQATRVQPIPYRAPSQYIPYVPSNPIPETRINLDPNSSQSYPDYLHIDLSP
ncbi:hypothetical protein A2130_01875 [Candidatus Woesebacteria bacterium GWC2_33_12]|nr:MAG: hypothetical protein A2130_01875 [Candidatus Woesebacteria bacterium GWC2_33_12]OGM86822.1 MAG: hypothetical protein A2616_02710 [Candidatus Woesebacteria bacterium RIFOXYD1_FULL_33_11]HCR36499.1 hypothetical protein [Candidatus Woesebacteria bacterium]